jgi:ribosomal-protein-alanine N-acetyltransferase
MADEAHITNVAVRKILRRQGIGELLLIALVELAAKLDARIITLEVRASNITAQSLYSKYGFTQVGLRRSYYTDDKEDGVIMSTPDISSATFQARLRQLKQAHFKRWRIALCEVA